jgi:hypothetical protein
MLLISANPMSARNVNVSLCACRRRCQSSPARSRRPTPPRRPADASAAATRAAANDRHQGDHRQHRATHPDHLRRRTEQPDATANIDRHDYPVSMLVPACDGRHIRPGSQIAADTTRKQRTVNPLMVPARYNFLYFSSRPALRAASGRPPARQRHDDHPGTGLTLPTRWSRSSHEHATQATLGQQHGSLAAPSAAWQPALGASSAPMRPS